MLVRTMLRFSLEHGYHKPIIKILLKFVESTDLRRPIVED